MALFGGCGRKPTMENLMQQLAAHPMLHLAADVLREEKQSEGNGDRTPADAWKHCVEGYYDDGIRTVFVYRDYLGVLHGKIQQMFPSEEDKQKGWKMPDIVGFYYTECGYEPLPDYCRIGYRQVMRTWTEVVRALMKKLYPDYQYSDCATLDMKTPDIAANELCFNRAVICYFTYTLPRPHYKKWFKEE